MSCSRRARQIAEVAGRLSAGIGHLASKRAFYAGLAGTGLIGAGLVALARRQWAGEQTTAQPDTTLERQQGSARPLRQLSPRTTIGPSPAPASARCAGCRTSGRSKSGAWYTIEGRLYCQDCAPQAARQARVELVVPEANGAARDHQTGPSPYLPPEKRIETELVNSRIRLNVGRDPEGQPVWYVVDNGYVLLRSNGLDSGLALTPALKIGPLQNGVQEVSEDTSRWWLTHIPSGKSLGSQPYASLAEAQLIGSVLAQVDWTRAEPEIPPAEISRARETIRRYNQALAEQNGKARTRPPLPAEPLTGRLVADGFGGVSRVLDTSPDGETLFVVDSLGKRYEVRRDQVRKPTPADFEMCRVARSFDPASQPETRCATCGQSAANSDGGKWYRMGWQSFCPACAGEYAAQEGYLRDEELSGELETFR